MHQSCDTNVTLLFLVPLNFLQVWCWSLEILWSNLDQADCRVKFDTAKSQVAFYDVIPPKQKKIHNPERTRNHILLFSSGNHSRQSCLSIANNWKSLWQSQGNRNRLSAHDTNNAFAKVFVFRINPSTPETNLVWEKHDGKVTISPGSFFPVGFAFHWISRKKAVLVNNVRQFVAQNECPPLVKSVFSLIPSVVFLNYADLFALWRYKPSSVWIAWLSATGTSQIYNSKSYRNYTPVAPVLICPLNSKFAQFEGISLYITFSDKAGGSCWPIWSTRGRLCPNLRTHSVSHWRQSLFQPVWFLFLHA